MKEDLFFSKVRSFLETIGYKLSDGECTEDIGRRITCGEYYQYDDQEKYIDVYLDKKYVGDQIYFNYDIHFSENIEKEIKEKVIQKIDQIFNEIW